jgi:hypothetical protein
MTMTRGRTSLWVSLAVLGLLVLASFWLGVNRIFQVDEVQYAALARLRATGRMDPYVTSVPFLLIGPLTWIAGAARDSAEVLVYLRMPFVALMWVNALLMVKAAGFRLRSIAGLYALLLVSTLAPMWDYGFEIRHDVLLVTASLGLWCLVRTRRQGPGTRLFLAGALGGLMQIIAFKGFMFALPLLGLGLVLARPWGRRQLPGLVALMVAGLAAGLLLGRVAHGLAGTWAMAWAAFKDSGGMAANTVERFEPWATVARLLSQAPLLACGALAALCAPFLAPALQKPRDLLDAPWFPEWCFALICLVMFFANPTPFPYNLLHLVPALAILLFRFREPFAAGLTALGPTARGLVVVALVLLHGLPWAQATWRHFDMNNDRQCEVIHCAEALTDPALHRVFDGAGLVSCRNPVGAHWLIHTFTIQHFLDGSWPSVRSMLAQNATPVILPNYRTAWLPKEDQNFIKTHYVALAADFQVLGAVLEPGTHAWEALAEGRYQVELAASPTPNPVQFGLDGREAQPGIIFIGKGEHHFQIPAGCFLRVAWVGPHLQRLPDLSPAPHPLFVNWY